MVSLFFRNLFFTILQPGVVVVLVPYLIAGSSFHHAWGSPFKVIHLIAVLLFAIGLFILLACITGLAVLGRGTLSPADPTKELVTSGLYRYSRNPMYVGVLCMLVAESMFLGNSWLWLYTAAVWLLFELFIRFFEEPRLLRDFGNVYATYRKKVRRWL